jgi:DNA (cytosine-5)-methyltransferase 1
MSNEEIKLKVGSMFAGIGGICLGFKQAGFDIVWANDIDEEAMNTYRHNFGDSYAVEGDIRKINPHSIPDIDILTAGFPCQPFSRFSLI